MTGIRTGLRVAALAGLWVAAGVVVVAGATAIGVALAQESPRGLAPDQLRGPAPGQPQPITPANPRFAPGTPDAPPPAVAPDLRPDDPFRPGFIDALGRWLGDSKAAIDQQLKSTQDAIDGIGTQATGAARDAAGAARDAAGAAQQATGTLMNLSVARVVVGRERCAVAANGAPDCAPAANTLCRSKGYAAGRVADINSAQKCPAYVWWSGRQPAEGECVPETFVLKAMCQ